MVLNLLYMGRLKIGLVCLISFCGHPLRVKHAESNNKDDATRPWKCVDSQYNDLFGFLLKTRESLRNVIHESDRTCGSFWIL